jgi:cytokinin dehydrogenase
MSDVLAAPWRESSSGSQLEGCPSFEGTLETDPRTLDAAGEDYGRFIRRRPAAVLRPASTEDIAKLVRYARSRGLKVAARGQGFSVYGQAQAPGGLVAHLGGVARVHAVDAGSALVDAGLPWLELVQRTVPLGWTPPVLPDYLRLSVGGTLSVGGVGGQSFLHGLQADHVLELEVVSGTGERVLCSPEREPALFDACRAGLGRFGIIARVRVRLAAAPPQVRSYVAHYWQAEHLLEEQSLLASGDFFDHVVGMAVPAGGRWLSILRASKYFAPGDTWEEPIGRGRFFSKGENVTSSDSSYLDFVSADTRLIEDQERRDSWDLPHPSLHLLLPSSIAAPFIQQVLARIAPEEMGGGIFRFYPLRRSRVKTPFFRTPDSEHFFLFNVLPNITPPTEERVREWISRFRGLLHEAMAAGGKLYPVDSALLSDWRSHFGSAWGDVLRAKERFDPDHLLAPGQGGF